MVFSASTCLSVGVSSVAIIVSLDMIGDFRCELAFETPENLDWCINRVGRYRLKSQGVPDSVLVMK